MAQLHESFITKYTEFKKLQKFFVTKVWSYTVSQLTSYQFHISVLQLAIFGNRLF